MVVTEAAAVDVPDIVKADTGVLNDGAGKDDVPAYVAVRERETSVEVVTDEVPVTLAVTDSLTTIVPVAVDVPA